MTFEKSEENLRVYKGVTLRRTNPFGFWTVEGSKEKFTQLSMATNFVDTTFKKLKKRT